MDSLDDINEIVNKWCDTFSESANKHAPIKTKRVKTTVKAPWMTSELLELMRERDFHLKHAKKSNSDYHWNTYRELRNFINQQVKICKSNYYQNLITSNKDNPGELWKTINEITSRNPTKTTPSCIISENIPVNEPRSIATIMNDYFTSIGSKLANKIKDQFKPKLRASTTTSPHSFQFEEVDELIVFQELSKLKTNMGLVLNCLKTPFALLHQLSQRSLISRYAVVHFPTSGRKVKLPPFTNLAIKRHRTTIDQSPFYQL